MQKKLYVMIAAFMLMISSAVAQVTTSGMSGKVKADNEDVIGATVEAVHTPSGTRYVAVTNTKGQFNINGMRSGGPYEVTISYIGYETKKVKDVVLQLGETYNLNTTMNEDTQVLGEVVVQGKATKLNIEKMGATTNITSAQMAAVPTVSRSITDMTRLSPYGGNGMTFQGSDGRTANFTVDGANFNNNFGLNSGLPGGGNPISIEAIEEMQVVISPYDVRQTNFIGGAINAVTKSGTNTFKGSAYIFHRNENMRGDTVDGEQVSGARDRDRQTTYGFTLGGPIIKDKLFFFANAEFQKSPTVPVRWRASENGVGDEEAYLSYASVQDMQIVSDFAKDKYGYDTGSFDSFPADEKNTKILGRIDWNISNDHHLAVRYNYTNNTNWNGPNSSSMDGGTRSAFGRTSLYGMSYANSMYSVNNKVYSGSIDLNSRFGNNISNQFLFTYTKADDIRDTNSSDFPFIDIMDGTGTNTPYISLGYELFTYNNAVHNTTWNIKDDVTWYNGNHKIMGGLSYEHQMADNAYMRNGTGYYRYKSMDDFLNQRTPEVVCLTYGYGDETNPVSRVAFNKLGAYVQDEWNVDERLKLTAGLRFDALFFNNDDLMRNNAIYDLDYNGRNIDTGKWPTTKLIVSPRIGFSYDVLGDKTLKVRGGTGLFSGRLPLVFFTNMPTNSGMVQYQAQLGPSSKYANLPAAVKEKYADMNEVLSAFSGNGFVYNTPAFRQKLIDMGFPNDITPETGAKPSSISAVDPNFKMPQVWKSSIAIDYQLPTSFPFSVTGEVIYNKMINDVCISDWSMLPVEGYTRFNGADNRPVFPETFRTNTKAFVLENTSRGYAWQASLQLNIRPIETLNIMAAYTHSVKKEVTSMPGSAAESAFTYVPTSEGPNHIRLHNAINNTPNRFVLHASHNDKHGNHLNIIYETYQGGYNYSYMLANDMNGDGYSYDALYIPTDEQVKNGEFRFVSDDDQKRFMDYVHSDSYLSKHQGEYAEAYSVYNPWVHRVDVSYKHDFSVNVGKTKHTLQLSCDIKNILNLFNSKWGVAKYMNSKLNSGRILKYEGTDAEGYPTFSTPAAVAPSTEKWVYNHAVGQCWYASVGIKYIFN